MGVAYGYGHGMARKRGSVQAATVPPAVANQSINLGEYTSDLQDNFGFSNGLVNTGGAITSITIDSVSVGTAGHIEVHPSLPVFRPATGFEAATKDALYVLNCTFTNAAGDSDTAAISVTITTAEGHASDGAKVAQTILDFGSSDATGVPKPVTLKLRPGDYTEGFGDADELKNKSWNGPSWPTFTSMSIESEDHDNMARLVDTQIDINSVSGLTVKWLECYMPTIDPTGGAIYIHSDGASTSNKIQIDDCYVHGLYRDPNGDYSAGYSNPGGIRGSASSNVAIRRDLVNDVYVGISLSFEQVVYCTDNYADRVYEDLYSGGSVLLTSLDYARNVGTRPIALSADTGNPHSDAMQWINQTQAAVSGLSFELSRMFTGDTRSDGYQAFFSNDRMDDALFRANFISTDNTKGIYPETVYNGVRIIGNTIVQLNPNAASAAATPRIQCGISSTTQAFGVAHVYNNITAQAAQIYDMDQDLRNNVTLGLSTSGVGTLYDYDEVFDELIGNFGIVETVADIADWYSMKTAGPADQPIFNAGVLGSGYGTFPTNIRDAAGAAIDEDFEYVPSFNVAVGEDGEWWAVEDDRTLWEDTAGTNPAEDATDVQRIDGQRPAYNLTQATAGDIPTYEAANNLLAFDGDDLLENSALGDLLQGAFTVVIAKGAMTLAQNDRLFGARQSTGPNTSLYYDTGATNGLVLVAAFATTNLVARWNWTTHAADEVLIITFANGTDANVDAQFYVDGVLQTHNTANETDGSGARSDHSDQFAMFGLPDTAGREPAADWHGGAVFNRVLTSAEITAETNFWKARQGR